MIIDSKEAYWKAVDENWDNILQIFMNVGANLLAKEGPYGQVLDVTLLQHLTKLKDNRDPAIAALFNAAWGAAPDRPYIHEWSSWGTFCDLCSETWVFYPEEGEDQ